MMETKVSGNSFLRMVIIGTNTKGEKTPIRGYVSNGRQRNSDDHVSWRMKEMLHLKKLKNLRLKYAK